jgi:hypothetical protein
MDGERGEELTLLSAKPETVRAVLRELLLVCFAAAMYGGVRALTEGSAAQAVANGQGVERFERRLGIAWEQAVQSAVIGIPVLVTAANWIYIWGHWPVIIASATLLYVRRPVHYRLLRNAMVFSGLIGFVFFYSLPTAPPRLLPNGLSDTVLEHSHAYRALQPPSLTNQYAAMPSLHFGWNLLVGVVLFVAFTGVTVRCFAFVMPFAMAFAVVATANHFVVDVLLGMVVAGMGLLLAVALERRRGAPHPNPPSQNPPRAVLWPRLH